MSGNESGLTIDKSLHLASDRIIILDMDVMSFKLGLKTNSGNLN